MKKSRLLGVVIQLSIFMTASLISQTVAAVGNPDYSSCVSTPLPSTPTGPSVEITWVQDYITLDDRIIHVEAWRIPCSVFDSAVLLRVTPITVAPFVCSSHFEPVIQNAFQYNSTKLVMAPDGNSFCNDLFIPTTFLLEQWSFDLNFNDDEAFSMYHDYDDFEAGPLDIFEYDPSIYIDTDGDGTLDSADTDDDNDGVPDVNDTNILNPNICEDIDTDSCDDCSIGVDGFGLLADNTPDNDGMDYDSDGLCDAGDMDDDNDGITDASDAFPLDPSESVDTDNDGVGNNADTDDDNDGTPDISDAFPLDPLESEDSDNDGIGDNADRDDDNDGMPDIYESENGFNPLNPADANADADDDGYSNLREYRAGSNPHDPTSIPKAVFMPWLPLLLE